MRDRERIKPTWSDLNGPPKALASAASARPRPADYFTDRRDCATRTSSNWCEPLPRVLPNRRRFRLLRGTRGRLSACAALRSRRGTPSGHLNLGVIREPILAAQHLLPAGLSPYPYTIEKMVPRVGFELTTYRLLNFA